LIDCPKSGRKNFGKEVARGLCPPVLWRLMSRMRHWGSIGKPGNETFSGVYPNFESITDQHPWTSDAYLESCRQMLRNWQAVARSQSAASTHSVLAFLINSLPKDHAPKLLDWAGGTGLRYWTTRPALNRDVQWFVVDDKKLAAVSREVMGTSDQLLFAEDLPSPTSSTFDVLLIYSSLHYVESQNELLLTLAAYRPRFIVLARLMALSEDEYVTCQNIQGFNTPCKVSNLQEIVGTLKREQYDAILTIEDGRDLSPLFNDDIPKHLHVGREWLVVFRRAV
jgi:putative methyltransferase (TIGR04325 family)